MTYRWRTTISALALAALVSWLAAGAAIAQEDAGQKDAGDEAKAKAAADADEKADAEAAQEAAEEGQEEQPQNPAAEEKPGEAEEKAQEKGDQPAKQPAQPGEEGQGQPGERPAAETEADLDAQLGLKIDADDEEGLTVSNVGETGLAAKAGLQAGDRIVEVNNREFTDRQKLHDYLRSQWGKRVPIVVMRDDERRTIYLTMDEGSRLGQPEQLPARDAEGALGVSFARRGGNIYISGVFQDSPAERAGLRPGDRLMHFNERRLNSLREAVSAVKRMSPGDRLSIGVVRNGRTQVLTATLTTPQQAFDEDLMRARGLAQRQRDQRYRVMRPEIDSEFNAQDLQRKIESLEREVERLKQQVEQLQSGRTGGADQGAQTDQEGGEATTLPPVPREE